MVFSWCEQSAGSCVEVSGLGIVRSDGPEAVLPFGIEAGSTDLCGDSPCKQGCRSRFCLEELGKSRALAAAGQEWWWALVLVGAGRGGGMAM